MAWRTICRTFRLALLGVLIAVSPARGDDETQIRSSFIQAWTRIESGKPDEADGLLRSLNKAHPEHRPTRRLVHELDRITPPCPDPDLKSIRSRLPGTWRETRSDHFLLIHQHTEAEATRRLLLAEEVFKTYYLWFSGLGLDLDAPTTRMVSVWFAKRSDYVDYLKTEGSDSFSNSHGHYSSVSDVVAIADERDEEGLSDRAADESVRQAREIATLAHETVHQLVSRSGLERPGIDWPRWLDEGVAMLFESSHHGHWAGVAQPNEHRSPLYRAIKPPPRLAATVRDLRFGPQYDPSHYGAAWGLVDFLAREHPREFVALLDRLRTPSCESIDPPDRAAIAFRSIFGDDWPRLETAWHAFRRSKSDEQVRFSLESSRPGRR